MFCYCTFIYIFLIFICRASEKTSKTVVLRSCFFPTSGQMPFPWSLLLFFIRINVSGIEKCFCPHCGALIGAVIMSSLLILCFVKIFSTFMHLLNRRYIIFCWCGKEGCIFCCCLTNRKKGKKQQKTLLQG